MISQNGAGPVGLSAIFSGKISTTLFAAPGVSLWGGG